MGQAIQTGATADLWRCIMADLGDNRRSPLPKAKARKGFRLPGLGALGSSGGVDRGAGRAIWSVMGRCVETLTRIHVAVPRGSA